MGEAISTIDHLPRPQGAPTPVALEKEPTQLDLSQPLKRSPEKEALLARLAANPQLPSPPAMVLQVLQRASQPDCSIADLGKLISQDPALCGKVLQTVNSAMFGLPRSVTSIDRALKLLGLKPLRSLILSLSLPALLNQAGAGSSRQDYGRSSVAMALVARALAIRTGRPEPQDDLVAGLLSDVGVLVLHQSYPDQYAQLLAAPAVLDREPCEAEEQLFGVHHAEISAFVLDRWHLPQELTEAIGYHHHPERAMRMGPHVAERAWLLHFATKIANLQAMGCARESHGEILEIAAQRFGMNEQQLGAFLEPLHEEMAEFAALLHVEIGTCASYAALFASASQELVNLSIEASRDNLRIRESLYELDAESPLAEPSTVLGMNRGALAGTPAGHSSGASLRKALSSGADGPQTTAQPRRLPKRLGEYEIIDFIGRGGMGVVLKAFDPKLRRLAAIKVLAPELASNPLSRKRFAREAQAVAAVNHENVVAVHAVAEAEGLPYLVMEYVAGLSLQERIEQGPPLGYADILRIGSQAAAGLAAAHAQRLIHRDIKPANILLDEAGHAKITDFGLARAVDDTSLTKDGAMAGTPQYMAPEQINGAPADHRADLFSLGSVLYAMCAGRAPFEGENTMAILRCICDGKARPLKEVDAAIPDELVEIVELLHAKDPADRFHAAADVAALLRHHLEKLSR